MACPATSWLPRLDRGKWSPGYLAADVTELPPPPLEERDTEAADWGTAMHAAKADPETSPDPWRYIVEPHRADLWPAALGVHEQAVSYDCRTGLWEIGPTNLPVEEMDAWKNSRGPDCVVGTCDWWALLPTEEPWVDDLKTGWREPEVVTPQMLFYAMVRAKAAGARSCYLSITHWPRKAEEANRDPYWRHVGPIALDEFEADLRRAWRRATGPNPDASPGPHCRYCPSAGVCDRANE
jgi:hypothetical protein